MADPLSIGASVLAFVGLAEKIIRLSKYCIDAVKDAPSDMQMILGEVSSVKAVVEGCRDTGSDPQTLVARLFVPSGPIDACLRCLTGLEALLPPDPGPGEPGKKRKITLIELAWPLKQSKARKLLAEISHYKASLLLAISGDTSHDIKEIQSNLNKVLQATSASESREVYQWLERRNPSTLHNAAFKKHEPHTSAWLLRSPEWRKWQSSAADSRFLWLHGLPGSGKTVLASFAIEQLKKIRHQNPSFCLTYYYCHYSHGEDEALPLLAWVVSQACRQLQWVPPELRDLFDQGHDPQVHELQNVLAVLLERLESLVLVIDAVDESSPRDELLYVVSALVLDKRFVKVRILATSREYFEIQRVFGGLSTAVSMSNSSVDEDVRSFVRSKLVASRRLYKWRHMFGEIEDVLVQKARGMFRWAECQIQSIERLRDMSELRPTLADLPLDISETYVRIFAALPEPDKALMRRIFIWVIGHSTAPWVAVRGINAKMLLSAVTWDVFGPDASRTASAIDLEELQELCGCLMTFREDDTEDSDEDMGADILQPEQPSNLMDNPLNVKERSSATAPELYVSLAHYTVLEFLTSAHILETPVAYFALRYDTLDAEFARGVLSQALAANPHSGSNDWVADREAYCLTLGAALKTGGYLAEASLRTMYLRYLSPSEPHYARFRPLQIELSKGRETSTSFYVYQLPSEYLEPRDGNGRTPAAETLLNLQLMRYGRPADADLLGDLLSGRSVSLSALLQAQVRLLVREVVITLEEGDHQQEVECEGTVASLLSGWSQKSLFPVVWSLDGTHLESMSSKSTQERAREMNESQPVLRFVEEHPAGRYRF